ncbi:MAG TPA: helix-turn-helix domain-containing protein [Gaiellaceae bacterium]|nr:helix-turn-helix domain-containing protein [Gaiellaceae bacterium]
MPAPRKIEIEQVVALRASGRGVRAIARVLGVAPSSISRILRRPEVAEQVARAQEHLAGRAPLSVHSHAPSKELESTPARSQSVWLLVRSGNWGFGARRGDEVVMRAFPAGLSLEVDEEVVDFVRKANSPQLLLGAGEPTVRVAIAGFGRPGEAQHQGAADPQARRKCNTALGAERRSGGSPRPRSGKPRAWRLQRPADEAVGLLGLWPQ